MVKMKIAVIIGMLLLCINGVTSDDGTSLSGTAGFTNAQTIGPYCNNVATPWVLPNNAAFIAADGTTTCGKTVSITCVDSTVYCDSTKQFTFQIANLCNGCTETFTFSQDDYNTIAPGGLSVLQISYVIT